MKAAIRGIGLVGGFGYGSRALIECLEAGSTPYKNITIETVFGKQNVSALLADTSSLDAYIPKKSLRRINHYVKKALLAGFLALEDAGEPFIQPDIKRGIIVATGYGANCNTLDFAHSGESRVGEFGSPTKFSNSVHNAAGAYLSMFLKENGPNLSISQLELSFPGALMNACLWLEEGVVDEVLVGGVDDYCNVMEYCAHQKENGSEKDGESVIKNQRAVVGEGAVFFLLSRREKALSAYAEIEDVVLQNSIAHLKRSIPVGDQIFFIGADGYSDCHQAYRSLIERPAVTASFTDLYGGLPVGMGFDLAIAAICLKNDRVYPGTRWYFQPSGFMEALNKPEAVGSRKIVCVKAGSSGAMASIQVSRRK